MEGPKGKLSWTLPEGITASVEGNQLSVDRAGESRQLRALHGTNRSLLNNMVIGVSEGFVKNLEIVGVGFRAAVKGNILDLNLGKSHPINQVIPEGLKELGRAPSITAKTHDINGLVEAIVKAAGK